MNKTMLLLAVGVSALAISSASAADLIIDTPVEAGVVEASGNWDGAFIGVFGGYGSGEYNADGGLPGDFVEPKGWLLGVAAGANFTLDNGIVLGVVGDIAWADLTDQLSGLGITITSTVDWAGSLRGRVGFDGGAFMPYLTAGLAFAHSSIDFVAGPPFPAAFGDNATHVGWTVGAGVEFAATEDLSVDLLYRYSDYGDAEYTFGAAPASELGLTAHQVSVGLNWHF